MVPPTRQISVVLQDLGVEYPTGRMMRSGLILAREPLPYPLINATVEKLDEWYVWKHAWDPLQALHPAPMARVLRAPPLCRRP